MHHQNKSGKDIRHGRVSPRKFRMPNMSSTDATIHAAQDLIHALQNTEPASPLVTPGNAHKEALISLEETFVKAPPPAVPLRAPIKRYTHRNYNRRTKNKTKLKNHTT